MEAKTLVLDRNDSASTAARRQLENLLCKGHATAIRTAIANRMNLGPRVLEMVALLPALTGSQFPTLAASFGDKVEAARATPFRLPPDQIHFLILEAYCLPAEDYSTQEP